MLRESHLDLAQLDAKAAKFDLMVESAQKLEVAVRPPADEVSGLVQPGTCRC